MLERRERAGNGPDGGDGQEGTAGIPRLHFLAPNPHAHAPPHIPAITSQLPPLTKESRHSEEDLPPALASPPQEATPGVGSSSPSLPAQGVGGLQAIPRMLLALSW